MSLPGREPAPPRAGDATFAEALNYFTLDPGPARREPRHDAPSQGGEPGAWRAPASREDPRAEDDPALDEDGVLVRPYAWTRGRTRPVQDLALEAMVSTAHPHTVNLSAEQHSIVELCRQPRSVAEVAALLRVPLGVVRVLLADMIDSGVVVVHRAQHSPGRRPLATLLERVLAGLRRL